jgi:uncharacterized damage-inducible protein DinB
VTPNDLLASGYRMGRQFLHSMVDDLSAEEFRHQPAQGANCAAWIVGHLAVVARRTAERLGATGLPVLTEEFIGRFSATKKPADTQPDLGEKAELLKMFDGCVEKLIEMLRTLPADALAGPSPAPNPFATNYGELLLFGVMHFTLHCGQLSTIRRSLGKPPKV